MPNYTLRRLVALFAVIGFVFVAYWVIRTQVEWNLAHPCVRMIADYCVEGKN